MFANSQAKPGTAFVAAACSVCTVEPFEDSWKMIFVDADAVVADLYQNVTIICFINAGDYCSVLFAVLG